MGPVLLQQRLNAVCVNSTINLPIIIYLISTLTFLRYHEIFMNGKFELWSTYVTKY